MAKPVLNVKLSKAFGKRCLPSKNTKNTKKGVRK